MDAAIEFLDIRSAALFLRVTIATMYAWVHQRKLPYRKHGRRVVFNRSELLDWSAARAIRPLQFNYLRTQFQKEDIDAMVPEDATAPESPKTPSSLKTKYAPPNGSRNS